MNRNDFNNHHDSVSVQRLVPVTKAPNPTSLSEVYAATALTSLASNPISRIEKEKTSKKGIEIPQRFTKNGRTKAVPFPLKLMKVLSMEEYNHIITWMPSGKSFVIIRPKSLVNQILPKYFKSVQYSSFTRKLHRWGFERVDDGAGEFYHKEFLQGRVDLAEKMVCRGEELPKSREAIIATKQTAHNKRAAVVSPTLQHTQKQLPAAVQGTPTSKKVTKPHVVSPNPASRNSMVSPPAGIEARRLQECIKAAAKSRAALAMMQRTMESRFLCAQERAFCAQQRAEQRFMEMESRRIMIQNSMNAPRTRMFPISLPQAGLGFRDFPHYPQLMR